MKLVCIKEFGKYEVGKHYEYWTNFGGLNHIVKDYDGDTYPFDGRCASYDRPYVFEYFQILDEYRDNQLDKIMRNPVWVEVVNDKISKILE